MHVSHATSTAAQIPALKPKDVSSQPATANLFSTITGATPANQTSAQVQFPALDDSDIQDSESAGKSVSSATSSMLGDSNTALAAQANLDPETVLQLLAD